MLAFGKEMACTELADQCKRDRPEVKALEVKVFLRPGKAMQVSGDLAYTSRTAMVIAGKDNIRPCLPNYVSMDEAHCMHEDNPPLPLVDFFIHAMCKKVAPDQRCA